MPQESDNHQDLPKELQTALLEIVNLCEKEDSWIRRQQIKLWKKNEEFWHGIQFIFWSETRQDWIQPSEAGLFEEGREESEGPFYDYVVNIYKAHGESIIAALSAEVPAVRFPPDNAEDDDDLQTSKTFSKIADLVQRQNSAKMLLLRALFFFWNQGTVFAYHPPKFDSAYGTTEIPQFKKGSHCEGCNVTMEEDVENCPACGAMTSPVAIPDDPLVAPKRRVLIELYSPLYVKVSYFAQKQKDFGYLLCTMDYPLAFLKATFPWVKEKLDTESSSEAQEYEKTARAPSSFSNISHTEEGWHLKSLRRAWIRPWQFENCKDERVIEELKKLYPKGCYVAFVGDVYIESRDEDFDQYWTVGKAGLSTHIHADPLGQSLIPLQELRNVHVNLTEETIEHQMASMFADPEVLNFDVYSRHEARPGVIYPAQPKTPDANLSQSFYESQRATLSRETQTFGQQIDKDAQFVVGSFPSIYGGPGEGNSRTAAEYNMSRQMALQRLSIAWTFINIWWAELMKKCVEIFVSTMIEDERFVQKEGLDYINVWIRRAELSGEVGEVEPEGSETFPVTIAQKQQVLMNLLQLNSDFVNAALFDTENRQLVADVFSFSELYIPGADQRAKQVREIREMMKGQLVPIEPEIDEDEIHISTLKNFLVGAMGMDMKITNPQAYEACKEHLRMHESSLAMKTARVSENSPEGEAPEVGVQ